MGNTYRGWSIQFNAGGANNKRYHTIKNGVVLTAATRVDIEREIDKQLNTSKQGKKRVS